MVGIVPRGRRRHRPRRTSTANRSPASGRRSRYRADRRSPRSTTGRRRARSARRESDRKSSTWARSPCIASSATRDPEEVLVAVGANRVRGDRHGGRRSTVHVREGSHRRCRSRRNVALRSTCRTQAPGRCAEPGVQCVRPADRTPDQNGLLLPAGFTSRIVAVSWLQGGRYRSSVAPLPTAPPRFLPPMATARTTCPTARSSTTWPWRRGAVRPSTCRQRHHPRRLPHPAGQQLELCRRPTPWGTWRGCEENSAEQGRGVGIRTSGTRTGVAHKAMGRSAPRTTHIDPVDGTCPVTRIAWMAWPTSLPPMRSPISGRDRSWPPWWQRTVPCSRRRSATVGVAAPTRAQVPGARATSPSSGKACRTSTIGSTSPRSRPARCTASIRRQILSPHLAGRPRRAGHRGCVLSHVDNITVDERPATWWWPRTAPTSSSSSSRPTIGRAARVGWSPPVTTTRR